jgi:hypothetical protein
MTDPGMDVRPGGATAHHTRDRDASGSIAQGGWMSRIPEGSRYFDECEGTWIACMNRIRRWRVPPRWVVQDWIEEMQAEGVMAVLEALVEFDSSYGVPLWKFVDMRIRGRAIARYRKEWNYSIRQVFGVHIEMDAGRDDQGDLAVKLDLRWGLSHLDALDRLIIERIFWGGETELSIARSLGVSQQWVNKRKNVAIARLRRMISS